VENKWKFFFQQALLNPRLDSIQLKNILYFYMRIIGIFRIGFEGAIAILLFKAYFLFKKTTDTGVAYG